MKTPKIKFLKFFDRQFFSGADVRRDEIDVTINYMQKDYPRKHTHDFWEIIFVVGGSIVNYLDGRAYTMKKGDICLVKPDNVHSTGLVKGEIASYYNFEIRGSFLENFLKAIEPSIYQRFSSMQDVYVGLNSYMADNVVNDIKKIFGISSNDIKKRQTHLKSIVCYLMSLVIMSEDNSVPMDSTIEKVFNLMKNPENTNCNIAEIAQKSGYCVEHLIRLFKKNGLETPHKVFISLKLDYACNAISFTDKKIIEIAIEIGISNVSYFNKIFKAKFNMTPSQYRNKNRNI
jgi:AraC-like DNA-binding protein